MLRPADRIHSIHEELRRHPIRHLFRHHVTTIEEKLFNRRKILNEKQNQRYASLQIRIKSSAKSAELKEQGEFLDGLADI